MPARSPIPRRGRAPRRFIRPRPLSSTTSSTPRRLFNLETFGNIYTRITNPTQAVLEERVAALEGGTAALAVASGHAAQALVFHTLLEPGDEFVAARQLYGGSINQFTHSFKKCGWQVRWADTTDPDSFRAALTPEDQGDLRRIDRQSRRHHHRHREGRRRRQGGRRSRSSSTTRSPRPICSAPRITAPTSSCIR